jgi:hypothetical protein
VARPRKNNADYFSHDAGIDIPVMLVLRQFWGITLIGIIRPFCEAIQSLPFRTFAV